MTSDPDPRERGLYAISVAAELTGAGVQNLRVYERRGLVDPTRTEGGTRRYSENDLDRVRRVLVLLDAGLNLAGIALVLGDNLDLDRLEAAYDAGVLRLTVPVAEKAKPRKIEVTSSSESGRTAIEA